VQFSNHTGYGKWQGEIFDAEHILKLAQGIFDINQQHKCIAILSGYMGSAAICEAVQAVVKKFKNHNENILYLCDPVIGNSNCYVKPEVLGFFKDKLIADIITPNQYEAEVLSGIQITDITSLKKTADFFHKRGIKIVVITGLKLLDSNKLHVFASDCEKGQYLVSTEEYHSASPINGTGDLFSSLILGAYLKSHNIELALRKAVFYLQQALHHTHKLAQRELQVLSVKYDEMDSELLPELLSLETTKN
jgi:pyridoxine kinase